mmetsp:Transcript_85541/g.227264  ORF Transcript_85541/g.227264 Transcript_85541/m.227264 type:complete len:95 (-) Transcript_85541:77-361(-)
MAVRRFGASWQVSFLMGILAAAALPTTVTASECSAGFGESDVTLPGQEHAETEGDGIDEGQLAATALNLLAAGAACLSVQQRRRLIAALHLAFS